MKHLLVHNGELLSNDALIFPASNRAFQYGDALFETIRVVNGKLLFLDDHLERLERGLKFLHMHMPVGLNKDTLSEQVSGLLDENGHTNAARVRLEIYRMPGGLYTPASDETGYLIQSEAIPQQEFILSKGLKVDVTDQVIKPLGELSGLKTCNSLYYVLAGIYKKEHELDDTLLLNTRGNIAESISSNLFIYKNSTFYTPPLSDACVAGVMRKQVINLIRNAGFSITEQSIKPEELLAAEEVFLTNAIAGINWVVAYKNKRYFNNQSRRLLDLLNILITQSSSDQEEINRE